MPIEAEILPDAKLDFEKMFDGPDSWNKRQRGRHPLKATPASICPLCMQLTSVCYGESVESGY